MEYTGWFPGVGMTLTPRAIGAAPLARVHLRERDVEPGDGGPRSEVQGRSKNRKLTQQFDWTSLIKSLRVDPDSGSTLCKSGSRSVVQSVSQSVRGLVPGSTADG